MKEAEFSPVINLFSGTTQRPAGHIAINELPTSTEFSFFDQAQWKGYLSYEAPPSNFKGEQLFVKDDIFYDKTTDSPQALDAATYGALVTIQLPPTSESLLKKAIEEFANLNKVEYSVTSNNCADNVLTFLKTAGYDVELAKTRLSKSILESAVNTPQYVAKISCELHAIYLENKAKAILTNKGVDPKDTLISFINNEINIIQNTLARNEVHDISISENITKKFVGNYAGILGMLSKDSSKNNNSVNNLVILEDSLRDLAKLPANHTELLEKVWQISKTVSLEMNRKFNQIIAKCFPDFVEKQMYLKKLKSEVDIFLKDNQQAGKNVSSPMVDLHNMLNQIKQFSPSEVKNSFKQIAEQATRAFALESHLSTPEASKSVRLSK